MIYHFFLIILLKWDQHLRGFKFLEVLLPMVDFCFVKWKSLFRIFLAKMVPMSKDFL